MQLSPLRSASKTQQFHAIRQRIGFGSTYYYGDETLLNHGLKTWDTFYKQGLMWKKPEDGIPWLHSEARELIQAQDPKNIEEELGDLLFTALGFYYYFNRNLFSRKMDLKSPAQILNQSIHKMETRLKTMQEIFEELHPDHSIEEAQKFELSRVVPYWEAAKIKLKNPQADVTKIIRFPLWPIVQKPTNS